MINETILIDVLAKIATNPNALDDFLDTLSFPNINFPTMGGIFFWNNLAEYNGWRIQRNTLTQHCRILDPNDVRRAWGGMVAMEKIFKKLADSN